MTDTTHAALEAENEALRESLAALKAENEMLRKVQGAFNVWQARAALTAQDEALLRQALEEAVGVCIETGSTKGSCDAVFDIADACAAAIRAMKEQS